MGVTFKAFGHFIPDKKVTNKELAFRFSLSEDSITKKTGIEERRYFENGATSDMIVLASLECLNTAKVSAEDIDCIIVATMTPDYNCPSTASIVHKKLQAKNASGFDIMAACSGFMCALELGQSLTETKKYKNVLVAGADKMSSCVNPNDRRTSVIFADGAGVCLLSYSETENDILDSFCQLNSEFANDIIINWGGSQNSRREKNLISQNYFLTFSSRTIFENGVRLFVKAINDILNRNKLSLNEIDFIIPHQSNRRLIEEVSARLRCPIEKFIINIDFLGNTSAGSIPIAISEALENNKLNGTCLCASVGAGFNYASSIIKLNL